MLSRLCRLLALSVLCLCPQLVLAEEASAWSKARGAAIRLVPGAAAKDGSRAAGLEIRLDPGWKTYWRNPGDSGVPPVFDWSKSDNLEAVHVSFPAPERLPDEGGVSIGYKHDVLFPLSVRAKDPGKPVALALALDYAVCESICVPAKGEASLRLEPGGSAPASLTTLIEAAEASVPLRQPIGAAGSPSVKAVKFRGETSPPSLEIDVLAAGEPAVFVEGPSDWFLPVPEPSAAASLAGGSHVFTLPLEGVPPGAHFPGTELTLTLVTPEGAVEAAYTLP